MEKDEKTRPASAKSSSAAKEEAVLHFWQENEIFKKSLKKESPKGEYIFYEGPPSANGKPGIHHLEARAFKDAILRYKTMTGYHVERKGGWDTHGLPVEIQVEKRLNLESKKAIEEYGVAKFNKECKESVWEYTDLWEKFTDRIGFWLDQKNPYVTYHNDYIESVWNVIKEANKQDLLYKDYKVVPWCPRCGTGLSSHELALGYQDVKDISVYVKFKILASSDTFAQVLGSPRQILLEARPDHSHKYTDSAKTTFILAWTTTPWTLPGNVALAIGEDMDYVKIEINNEFLILAKSRLSVIDGEYKIVEEMKGKDLVGLEYEPLFPYLSNIISGEEKLKMDKAFKVYPAKFVTTEDGTGVVHTAVMYGQDDFELGNKIGLPKCHLVGLDGKFLMGTDFLEGRLVRDEDVAVDIIKELAHRGLLLKKEKYEHSYPHCWRCKTALIYYARDSWYIKMTSLRDKMVKENEGINWEPANIKEGRFGEWLRDIKDWAISRERYWGTPLPVWTCDKCNKIEVLGSLDDIRSKVKKSGNKYFVMRHGEAENNTEPIVRRDYNHKAKLTEIGVSQVLESIDNLKEKIDVIISSPFERAKETTEIVCKHLNFPLEKVIYDDRAREGAISSIFDGKEWAVLKKYFDSKGYFNKPKEVLPGSESFAQMIKRVGELSYEIERDYSGKNILIISHSGTGSAFDFVARGLSFENLTKEIDSLPGLRNGEIKELDFAPLPHNEDYELDFHKPYIDEVKLVCDCGGNLERAKEVMDVWLDSGSMPFAQSHYPFEKKDFVYPADFISEGVDQTRGWFYTLHAVGNIMGKGKAFKNVICLGLLLDAKGKKMSKSLGNGVDPIAMIDKYGVDTLRLWMYSVNQPGEPKNFDEKTVGELHNKIFNLLYNVIAFYELYRDKKLENNDDFMSNNILDKWIISRFLEVTEISTKSMESYKLLEPIRAMRDFIDDLSTWYLRRSRDRIKNGDEEAKKTLYFVFKNLAKLMAPFAPFSAEDIWQKLKTEKDEESVHLISWPASKEFDNKIIKEMKGVRDIVTLGLQARQKAGIPVRQPLGELLITNYQLSVEYFEIVKEELNIKEIKLIKGEESKVEIDTNITEELKKEGQYRELVRAIQDIRKKNGLNTNDIVILEIFTAEEGHKLVEKFKNILMKSVGASDIIFKENDGVGAKIDNIEFVINVVK